MSYGILMMMAEPVCPLDSKDQETLLFGASGIYSSNAVI